MATYTAGDQINRALRLLGVLAEGETPSASESADALMALNQMLDSWSTESLSVFTTTEQVFIWPANTPSCSLGPTGTFIGTRPVVLDDSTYCVINNISYPIQIVNQEQYNTITLKTATSTIPQALFVNTDYPNTTLYLWPVPSQAVTFHFVSGTPLAQPVGLTTLLSFPPGYLRAFTYNLAMEMAPEFGVQPSADVRRNAITSKRDLKRVNQADGLLEMPSGMLCRGGGFNIYAGQ